jgi:hypothetical protein
MKPMTIPQLNNGRTGAKLSVQLFNEMRRRKQKYGMVIRHTADAWGRDILLRLAAADKGGQRACLPIGRCV